MLAAAEVYVWMKGTQSVACAKLHHENHTRCIFCGKPAGKHRKYPHFPSQYLKFPLTLNRILAPAILVVASFLAHLASNLARNLWTYYPTHNQEENL